ncbi:MAG: ABC transporter permease [Acidobacteriales bacterium]|nr:ABC transporter permease [Terriglobales bacterium]
MSASPSTVHTPQQVAGRRAKAPHTSMFVRMLIRAAVLRRGRAASALLAMVVAAAVATAMMNLYVDVQAKLRTEFRNYGANVVVVAKESNSLPADALARVESSLGSKTLAVPFSYAVARTKDGQSVVVVGTDFNRARQLNRWWNVSHWPNASPPSSPSAKVAPTVVTGQAAPKGRQNTAHGASRGLATETMQASEGRQTAPVEALVGMRAATAVTPDRKPFELTFQGRTLQLSPAGLLQTGASEDSRIYLDQSEFQTWTGVAPSTIEIAVNGSSEEIEQGIKQLTRALPTVDVRPVRQIMEAEANVLNKTRATLYAAATLIVLTAALCVLATLIGWVFDRRRDFAIMKALGASERLVNGFFAAEAAALGAIGAVLGFGIGIGVAAWIGRVNFHAPVVPRFSVFPYVLAGSIAVALISAVLPIGLLRRVQPALILRGE